MLQYRLISTSAHAQQPHRFRFFRPRNGGSFAAAPRFISSKMFLRTSSKIRPSVEPGGLVMLWSMSSPSSVENATATSISRPSSMAWSTGVSSSARLKGTIADPNPDEAGRRRYDLRDVDEYDRLRKRASTTQRVLGVLYLPREAGKWLDVSPERLAMEKAAYWVSLAGAPPTTNRTSQRVFLPRDNLLTPEGMIDLFHRIAREETLTYVP